MALSPKGALGGSTVRICRHTSFESRADIITVYEDATESAVAGWVLEVTVHCADCGRYFSFEGMPTGHHPQKPTSGEHGWQARLPLKPMSPHQSLIAHNTEALRDRLEREAAKAPFER